MGRIHAGVPNHLIHFEPYVNISFDSWKVKQKAEAPGQLLQNLAKDHSIGCS